MSKAEVEVSRIVAQCVQSLIAVNRFLDKAEHHAEMNKMKADAFLSDRLAPDMKPLSYQVQSACDYVKAAAAWLSGQAPPKHEDNERTIKQLHARIKKTVTFTESVEKSLYRRAGDQNVRLSWAPGRVMSGEDYLLEMTIPNVYFHIAMVYAILRNRGVDVGKIDFLGPITLTEAVEEESRQP